MKLLRLNQKGIDKSFKIRGAQDYMCVDPRNGIYWIDIYRDDKSPKRLCRSLRTKNKELAKTRAEEIVARWLGHEADGSKVRIQFWEVCDQVLERMEGGLAAKKIRKPTYKNAVDYIGKGKRLRAEFGHLMPSQITESVIWGGFVARFQKENPGKTLYNHWKHMCMVMRHAYMAGYIDRPWKPKNPDPKKKVGRVLSEDEKTAVLEHASPMLRDQLVIAMTMGMRLREILKLEWDRVDLKAKTITLMPDDTKTNKGRVMRMSPQAYAALKLRKSGKFIGSDGYYRRIKVQGSRYVFPSRGNPNAPTNQNKTAWKTAKRKAGIKGRCRFHDLRHTFLTECAKLVREGHVSVVLVCSYAGLSIKTFERVYLHLTHDDTAAVADLVAVKLREFEISEGVIH